MKGILVHQAMWINLKPKPLNCIFQTNHLCIRSPLVHFTKWVARSLMSEIYHVWVHIYRDPNVSATYTKIITGLGNKRCWVCFYFPEGYDNYNATHNVHWRDLRSGEWWWWCRWHQYKRMNKSNLKGFFGIDRCCFLPSSIFFMLVVHVVEKKHKNAA